jgi:hypothetical protein
MDVAMRIVTAIFLAGLGGLCLALADTEAQAQQGSPPGYRVAQAAPGVYYAPRRRVYRRVPVYPRADHYDPDVIPRYNPGPNAVRVCTATYVQEYRPSGTVITPRMSCYWRPG